MNGVPSAFTSFAPSPRSASVASGAGSSARSIAVGWNCTNSASVITAPASAASARPSPRDVARGGGHRVEAAEAAGGEHRRRRDDLGQRARRRPRPARRARGPPRRRAGGARGQPSRTSMRRRGAHRGDDRLHDRRAGAVAADPGDAGAAVGGLQALHEAAALGAVERRAERGQAAHGAGPSRVRIATAAGIAEASAGGDGVGGVQLRRVVVRSAPRPCRPAPRPRSSPRPSGAARQHQRAPRRGRQRRGEAGEARADDQHAIEASRSKRSRPKRSRPKRSRVMAAQPPRSGGTHRCAAAPGRRPSRRRPPS